MILQELREYLSLLDEKKRRGKQRKGRESSEIKSVGKGEKEQAGKGAARTGASTHNPFKRHSTLGPTGIHGDRPPAPPPQGTRSHSRRTKWRCRNKDAQGKALGKYKQRCVGIGAGNKGKILNISIDPGYKSGYNKSFKRYRTKMRKLARSAGKKNRYSAQ